MEWRKLVSKGINENLVINTLLIGAFAVLSFRSVEQQNEIEALQAEKDSLLRANKSMKKSMWNWKQQLLAEASTDASPLPLSRLKIIYGESPATQQALVGASANEDSKSPLPKFVI